ncbi:WbqC family protein [Candidatus Hydrogenosomobacter endosymbioticus]|uniref:WbqC-like family protein n=1 Tax=Candidatus Hydrogenosomobacter endosymbioticus TaxID=2558174 RepID=A0ABM7V8C2_9PROT|nr:WbqC family protein [Candidatus Hydrogenosomobacter endosymbioticus]BDB96022.1 hypothetical protein HYD_1550 [Candidatus Hydrogenosomobacter endosymbioticus]
MKIAIHQPNFLPWMGYFYKMHMCDTFVILDDVQYVKESYINRTRIIRGDKSSWLTIPVKKHKTNTPISDIEVYKDSPTKISGRMRAKNIAAITDKLELLYSKRPFSNDAYDLIEIIRQIELFKLLLDINMAIINYINDLWFRKKIVFASEMNISSSLSNRTFEILRYTGGDEYISGNGARIYQNEDDFAKNNLKLTYVEYPKFIYKANYEKSFGISVLDYIADNGSVSPF